MSLLTLPWEDIVYLKIFPLLSLEDCFKLHSFGDEYSNLVENYFIQLKKLKNDEVISLNQDKLEKLASKTESLEILHLRSCQHLTSDVIKDFLHNNCKTLTHVNVADTNIDVRAFHGIIHCKKLRQLILQNNLWVGREFLFTVCERLRSLVFIDINGCKQLDEIVALWNFWYMSPKLKCVRAKDQVYTVHKCKKRRQDANGEEVPDYNCYPATKDKMFSDGWLVDDR